MKIRSFGINNCLGFPDTGVIKNDKSVNPSLKFNDYSLFIGKNDSGKSNVGKALVAVCSILFKWSKDGANKENFLHSYGFSEISVGEKVLKGSGMELFVHNKETNRRINFEIEIYLDDKDKEVLYKLPFPKVQNLGKTIFLGDKSRREILKLGGQLYLEGNLHLIITDFSFWKEMDGGSLDAIFKPKMDIIQKDIANNQGSRLAH